MMRYLFIVLILLFSNLVVNAQIDDIWKKDLDNQRPSKIGRLNVFYQDSKKDVFIVQGDTYSFAVNLSGNTGHKIYSMTSKKDSKFYELLNGNGIYFEIIDANMDVFTSLLADSDSYITVSRMGPYYCQIIWNNILFENLYGTVAPIKGEAVFHCYPDKFHISFNIKSEADIEINSVYAASDLNARSVASPIGQITTTSGSLRNFAIVKRDNDAPTCAFIYPVTDGIDDVLVERTSDGIRITNYAYNSDLHKQSLILKKNDNISCHFQILSMISSVVSNHLESEIKPLLNLAIKGSNERYDPIRGCYILDAGRKTNVSITNSNIERKIYVMHKSEDSSIYRRILFDGRGNYLPILTQQSNGINSNYNTFSETIYPLHLQKNEVKSYSTIVSGENWGKYPSRHISSFLDNNIINLQTLNGINKTTSYTPIDSKTAGISEIFTLLKNNQNIAGHRFLTYQDDNDVWHYLNFTGINYKNTGPIFVEYTLSYISDDSKIKVTLDVLEYSQSDEMRHFLKMRIDFLDDVKFKNNDIATNMIILAIDSIYQNLNYTQFAYGTAGGRNVKNAIKFNDKYTIKNTRLPNENAYAAIFSDIRGNNSFIIRKFEGKIDGKNVDPAISLLGTKERNSVLMLVPQTRAQSAKKGDFIIADLIIMPYTEGKDGYMPARQAAYDFGQRAPEVVNNKNCDVVNNFPSIIKLQNDKSASFSIRGGKNKIPIIIHGLSDNNYPELKLKDKNKLISIDSVLDNMGYQMITLEDGSYGCIYLFNTDGKQYNFVLESGK
ncbi:MAG: hypothetical protein SNJ70_04395 [Armatimonadota bacterium]